MRDELVKRLRETDEHMAYVFPVSHELDCKAAADQIEADGRRIAELKAALREMFEVVCGETGFAQAVRADSGFAYPWPALDIAEAKARAALGDSK